MKATHLVVFVTAIHAQHFIPTPKYTKKISSRNYAGASISYKNTSICEITPGVASYSGYVTLPGDSEDRGHETNLFFWYFEARNDPLNAPLSIYVGGGPGSSSLDNTNGLPCTMDSASNTTLNPWSWNTNVNMLYVDQPSPAGFSYANPADGLVDLLAPSPRLIPVGSDGRLPEANLTMARATLSGQGPEQTVLTTPQAAAIMWSFAQVWFQEFPEYRTSNDQVSLWTTSYGGIWGPAILAHFERQNEAIEAGTLQDAAARVLNLGVLGLTNACADMMVQTESWPQFAHNNTYGIQAIPQDVFDDAMTNLTMPDGCRDQMKACRSAARAGDPLALGTNETVNKMCAGATAFCFEHVQGAYGASGRNPFDITMISPASFPPLYSAAFLNQRRVQEELGAAVNFTQSASIVTQVFFEVTGDPARADKAELEYLLSRGVGLAMVYGDSDYRCNWVGGEALSLALEQPLSEGFRAAGYAPIRTNEGRQGGLVRQHGNVSFSRVFDAGHSVAAYQPETVFRIFERSMFDKDVASGEVSTCGGPCGEPYYSSEGPMTIMDVRNEAPASPDPICLIVDAPFSCATNQLEALADGSAVVEDNVIVSPEAAISNADFGKKQDQKDAEESGGVPPIVLPGVALLFTTVVAALAV